MNLVITDVLTPIAQNNPGTPLADEIEDAIADLQDALDALAETPPDRREAVDSIEDAVGEIEDAVDEGLDPAEGDQRMDQLTGIARQLVVDAIDHAVAAGADPEEIEDAQEDLADGDAERADGDFDDALDDYQDAVKNAERALAGGGLAAVSPGSGTPGQSLDVTLAGNNTNFQDGVTEARFGRNLSVGGNPEGDLGPVTVQDATSATASVTIGSTAALGPRSVMVETDSEVVGRADRFAVLAPGVVAIGGTTVSTVAGAGTAGDGQGTAAQFNAPRGIARDAAGNLYVADTNNHRIRKITPGGTVSTLAGSGTPGLTDGQGVAAQFDSPEGVAVDAGGTVYVADTQNHVIRKILPDGTVSTLAGSGDDDFADGVAADAEFDTPRSIALRPDGLLVVVDEDNQRVRLVDPVSGTVSTLAGSGDSGFEDGPPEDAEFASLVGIASDSNGNIYVADTDNQRIRKIAASDGTVSTFAGTGAFGFADGPAASAQFADPSGVTVDSAGNVYVADSFNSLIRRITPAGHVETVAGTGVRGADDGPGTTATFRTPQALVTGSDVFIADTGNHLIRQLLTVPVIAGLDPTSGVQDTTFTLTITGANLLDVTAMTFLKEGVADTDITATGLSANPQGTELTATVTIQPEATVGDRIVIVTTPAGASPGVETGTNIFTVLGKLILTPDFLTITQGGSADLTISVLNPAPAGGIEVMLQSAGPEIATVTAPVTIVEGDTSTAADVTGVSPGGTNVTATAVGFGAAQGVIDVQAFQGGPPPTTFEITEPADGATVPEGTLVVRGTVEAGGEEVGVTVKGVLASVQGNTFAALVPITPDTTSLTATATTASGGTANDTIGLTVTPAPDPASILRIRASPPSGVAPLAVTFSLFGGPVPVSINLDLEGDGTTEFSGPSLEGQTFTYTQAGLFFPTVTVTDADGNQFTASTVVQVHDQAALGALLQAKWNEMKDALRAGDIQRALTQIVVPARPRYEALFQALSARLPSIDAILTDLTLDEIGDQEVFYEMVRTDAGVTKSFEIRFSVDEDGVWRLRMF